MSQENGVVERRNQILLDMVRSIMRYSDLPKFLWEYALEIATYILNSVPIKYVPNTPVSCGLGAKLVYKPKNIGVSGVCTQGKDQEVEN